MVDPIFSESVPRVLAELDTNEQGLLPEEARARLLAHGANSLPEPKTDGVLIIFARQFTSPLIYVLVVAGIILAWLGSLSDATIIAVVLVFNAIVGTIQEGKAQNTLQALRQFVTTKATVLRGGKEFIIPDTDVVVGDIILLSEGEKVPADAYILSLENLTIEEAALTGESTPVHKEFLLDGSTDKHNPTHRLLRGTTVVAGSGTAVVTATGANTFIGTIAKDLSVIHTDIPLESQIRALSRIIVLAVLGISIVLFTAGLFAGEEPSVLFATVVSIAVAVIPEGLPIVVTLVLATGVWRMSRRNALVKRLAAVEALGQAEVIAVDKTGTLTKNEMLVERVYVGDTHYFVSGSGYEPVGTVRVDGKETAPEHHPDLLHIATASALCSSAHVLFSEENKQWRVTGDPTEAALVVFARKLGFTRDKLEHVVPKIAELPFTYQRKYHATLHQCDDYKKLTVIGAPEVVLALSNKVWQADGKKLMLTKKRHEEFISTLTSLSEQGLRVVAVATATYKHHTLDESYIGKLSFGGFIAMKDGLRPEVPEAMQKAHGAGIRVVMITGDYEGTAKAIAKEAGIFTSGDRVLSGVDIERFTDPELAQELEGVTVFARVTPEHKMRIIQAYRARGEIVAMTGDGVNDASSLAAADLGVAMGKVGTEVAKEAADIVLLDDNFGSIVSAVEEGRGIYRTVKKVILYLFSANTGGVLAISGGIALGFPLILLPAQIIWLNLVTDGLLDVALAMDPHEKGLLKGRVKRPGKYLVDRLMAVRIFVMAVPMAIGTLLLYSHFIGDVAKAGTLALTTLAVAQWYNFWSCRSEDRSIFTMNPFSNKYIVGAIITIVSLHIAAVHMEFFNNILHTVPLTLSEWGLALLVALPVVFAEEFRKLLVRTRFFHIRSA